MATANFTRNELEQILKACALLEIDDCTPPYLQDFIVRMLRTTNPPLSHKVSRLSAEEMHKLCGFIKESQSPV